MTKTQLVKLSRQTLLINLQKRNIQIPTDRYTNRKKMAELLINYFEDQDENADQTIYHSAAESLSSSEEELVGKDSTDKNLPKSKSSKNSQNTQPSFFMPIPQQNPNMFHHMYHQQQIPFQYQFHPQYFQPQQFNANQQAQQFNKKKSPEPFTFNNRLGSKILSFDLEESMQDSLDMVSKNLSRRIIRAHPYLKALGRLGKTIPTSLKFVLDWDILRCVRMWKPIEKIGCAQKDALDYATTRIFKIEHETYEKRQSFQKEGSLLSRIFYAIDGHFEMSEGLGTHDIDKLVSDMERMDRIELTSYNHYQNGRDTWEQRQQMQLCNNFNSSKGCTWSDCTRMHFCSKCFKNGERKKHPGWKCSV